MIEQTSTKKQFKLAHHQKDSKDDVLFNTKLLGSDVSPGDIIEIYHEEQDHKLPRLLLQIPDTMQEECNYQKDTISVKQSIATTFQLKAYKNVIVNKVNPKSVALELINLTFKDQYLGRSDMWRLKKSLVHTVVYHKQKIEFCSRFIRLQVYEMWSMGDKVACGYVTEDTKIVFRSSTSMAYLFIQMSSEMWEFDFHGELYFEKAANGFLADLFSKWKDENSNHEVTIVLFSRTFYKATSIEEFPADVRDCIQEDQYGRFYEDFYRIAIQNERFDDWTPMLTLLKRHFYDYPSSVINYHDCNMPQAYNSDAAQGNFLEVLNISLNVFEKHFLDRSFDRTGQMSVVITPGVGVFEVDRELINITKQRIIDNGVGSDLVCLGEQPLHAVPLLKFHKQRGGVRADDYSMPHTWINLSFYSSSKSVCYDSFVPRIKVPKEVLASISKNKLYIQYDSTSGQDESNRLPNSVLDYNEYDAQVFKLPSSQNHKNYHSLQAPIGGKKKPISQSVSQSNNLLSIERKLSEPELFGNMENVFGSAPQGSHLISNVCARSPAINIPARISENKISHSFGALNIDGASAAQISNNESEELSNSHISKVGASAGNSPNEPPNQIFSPKVSAQTGRYLINPFDPSHMKIKRTSNRRRWIHIFPKGPTGVLIQTHHHTKKSSDIQDEDLNLAPEEDDNSSTSGGTVDHTNTATHRTLSSQQSIDSDSIDTDRGLNNRKEHLSPSMHPVGSAGTPDTSLHGSCRFPSSIQRAEMKKKKLATLMWGATGEQQWNAAITTGVDWKSLTFPACLPITTDYFPDERSLSLEHEVASNYTLLPTDPNDQSASFGQKAMSPQQVFHELVSQRLSQGFQLCVDQESASREQQANAVTNQSSTGVIGSLFRTRSSQDEPIEEYKLSIGRVYHKLQLTGSTITVSIYRPRHPYAQLRRRYRYRFQAPDMGKYKVAKTEFYTERLENYKWSYLDNYICAKGESVEFPLQETLKFWRTRILLVPDFYRAKTISLTKSADLDCDIYKPLTYEEQQKGIDGFIKFFEILHRLKRHGGTRRSKDSGVLRERLGSNRIVEHPRVRQTPKTSDASHDNMSIDLNEADSSAQNEESSKKDEEQLSIASDHSEIIEAMKHPTKGLVFMNNEYGLPPLTFISAEATFWVVERVEGISDEKEAALLMEEFVKAELICHASGQKMHPFVHGFYLYYIYSPDAEYPICDTWSFQNEWHQAACITMPPKIIQEPNSNFAECPAFLLPNLPSLLTNQNRPSNAALYHAGRLDVDINNKSDRCEWGHIKYQAEYSPLRAYEIVLQWLCATGTIITELILNWQRKASSAGIHLFPIPCDPFAAPYSYQCNPLRGPIVIPLEVSCLKDGDREPFILFPQQSWPARMHLFQVAIIQRFGFIPFLTQTGDALQNQFVHITGSMFVLINTPGISSHSQNTTAKECYKVSEEPGYLWVFNHMLSKKWRSQTSGDELLGERVLKDFKQFCSNENNRLRNLWDSYVAPLPTSDEKMPR